MSLQTTDDTLQRTSRRFASLVTCWLLTITVLSGLPTASAAGAAADLDQCANGTLASPTNPCAWQNGNLGNSNSHFAEGQSVPFRMVVTGLSPGATVHTLDIGFDITNSGKHAYDYLTSFQRITESVNPCLGVSPCALTDTEPMPAPTGTPQPLTSFNALPASQRLMSMYQGNIISVVYLNQGDFTQTQSEAIVRVTFTAASPSVVFAWGGHIGSANDWGAGQGASGVSGSPYHMRLKALDGGGGNQDRSLKADAVAPPPPQGSGLTVVKHVINDDGGTRVAADFSVFVHNVTAQNVAGSPHAGSETGTLYLHLPAGTYTVGEGALAGYALTISGDCAANGSVTLVELGNKTCTLTNNDIRPKLTVTKVVVNDDGGTATVAGWNLFVGDTQVQSGVQNGFGTGSYNVTEQGNAGYTGAFTGDCNAQGLVTLAPGYVKACTITNNDVRPRLTVTKVVVNNDGGTKVISDFPLFVDASGVTSGAQNSFAAGLHTVSETGQAGYNATISGDCAANGQVTLAPGDAKACTITNNDIRPKLTVTKVVINDDGGSATISAWSLFVDATQVTSGVQNGFAAGSHVVSESGLTGYSATFSGDCNSQGQVSLAPGDVKACTITNNDVRPRLTVTKVVVNDDGGTKVVADFPLFVDTTGVTSGVQNGFAAGLHRVSETGQAGYSLAITGDCDAAGNVTLASGDVKACTLTNNDIRPRLTVVKMVVNNNGGTAVVQDAQLFVDRNQVTSGQQNGFQAGAHNVTEVGPAGYAPSFSGDCDQVGHVILAVGDAKTCIITNDDIQPLLTVTKVVINNNGGTATVSDFPLFVDGQAVTSGAANGFNAGVHTASETGSAAYSASISGDCDARGNVTLAPGDVKSCTITNNDIQPRLTVTKVVINDNGGTATVQDFQLFVGNASVSSGQAQGFNAGTYNVSEQGPGGYAGRFSGDCDAQGHVVLHAGDQKTCTVTNNDIQPRLTVVKVVINDNGGTAVVSDFPLFVDSASVTSGGAYLFNAGPHTVSETGSAAYAASFSGDCDSNGGVTLAVGDAKRCTITNNDNQPRLRVTKVVINDNGGEATVQDFSLNVGNRSVVSGSFNGFNAGTYPVTESGPEGYGASFSGDCDVNGTVVLQAGDVKSCVLTNDDIQPRLTVTKVVINDDGGTAVVADWRLFVGITNVTSGQENGFNQGIYNVSEQGPGGYARSFSGDCNKNGAVQLFLGQVKSCTIINNDIAPLLTVVKIVVNDDGGTATSAAWNYFVDGDTQVENGATNAFLAGNHTVGEVGLDGYSLTFSGDCDGAGHITLVVGDNKTCTLTNNDVRASLTVTKVVVNDDGGTAVVSEFPLFVDDTSVTSGSSHGFDAGTHFVSETGKQGYHGTITGDCDSEGQVSLVPGDVKACTVTNNDIRPLLTVVKMVVNDDGGTAVVTDAQLFVDGGSVVSGEQNDFAAARHNVTENGPPGYAPSFSGDCDSGGHVVLAVGDVKTCVITNDDIRPLLTLTKVVINDDGGTAVVGSFPLFVDNQTVTSGATNGYSAGLHVASEHGSAAYAASVSGDCNSLGNVTLVPGDVKACVITNDDIQPRLTVIKRVINDNGGLAEVSDFSLKVAGDSVVSGDPHGFHAGTYNVTETGPSGYAGTFGGDCDANGTVELRPGQDKTCILTNNDIQPRLRVTKIVVNDDGRTSVVADWDLFVGPVQVTSGAQGGFDAGSYSVVEQGPDGYNLTYSGDCNSDGTVVLFVGDVKACTLTNDDQPRPPTPACPAGNASANADGTITVSWVPAPGTTGVELYRSVDAGSFVLLGTFGPEVTSYHDNDTATGSTFSYRLAGLVGNERSPDCEVLEVVLVQVPLFPTPLALGFALIGGLLGVGFVLRRWRKKA